MIFSFVSVSCNTPKTFRWFPPLKFVTITIDIVTGIAFVVEVCMKLCKQKVQEVSMFNSLLNILLQSSDVFVYL